MTQGVKGSIRHGTRSCYMTGCRQPECVEAQRKWAREYYASRKAGLRDGTLKTRIRHGTTACRALLGCNRPECIEAVRRYDREYRARNAEMLKVKRRERYQLKVKGVQHVEESQQVLEPAPVQP